ncbi:MAG: glycosyltransferase family 2 protein, partial [Planctomycetia bacterium]|nr:glycosyltransferase family 2 protein [Planctomycetia bacterium]
SIILLNDNGLLSFLLRSRELRETAVISEEPESRDRFTSSFEEMFRSLGNHGASESETVSFIRYEPELSVNSVLHVLKMLRRLTSGRIPKWQLIWLCHDQTNERHWKLSKDCFLHILPESKNFAINWNNTEYQTTEEFIRLSGKFADYLKSKTVRQTVIRGPEQKTVLRGCDCAFYPVEVDGEVPERTSHVNLTLGAIVRDRENYIKEWLAFHKIVGFNRFVIVLHKCADKTEERIRELPFYNDVCIHHVSNDQQFAQMGTYQWILKNYGKYTKWLAFLDSDEFLYGIHEDNMNVILERYEDYGGLIVHWKWFGANDHTLRPDGLIMENYTRRAKDDFCFSRGIKSIIQPSCFEEMVSSHRFFCMPDCVREDFRPVERRQFWEAGKSPIYNIAAINHYKTGSMQDWCDRAVKGNCNEPFAMGFGAHRFEYEDRSEVEDFAILRFADRVRKLIRS